MRRDLMIPCGVVIGVILLTAISPVLHACSIPVFRYALENWPADPYEVAVFHKGPLNAEDQKVANLLASVDPFGGHPNIAATFVDVAAQGNEEIARQWSLQGDAALPRIVVGYPSDGQATGVMWSAGLSTAAVKALVDSPKRHEIARRILSGDTAVWVLVESSDQAKNDRAAALLEKTLAEMAGSLRLPDMEPEDRGMVDERNVPLRVAFSTMRIARTDPAEDVLLNSLLRSEEGLATADDPVVFPVFGRGRALCALMGKGINTNNIGEVCAFLVGWCSCEIKEDNPGTTLLLSADWDASFASGAGVDREPPLPGSLLAFTSEPDTTNYASSRAAERTSDPAGRIHETTGTLKRNMIILGFAVLAAIGAVTLALRGGRKR